MQHLLAEGGFELRQWASNAPQLLQHLPQHIKSENYDLWFSTDRADHQEHTLVRWQCRSDMLGYKHSSVIKAEPSMRHIHCVPSSQYNPLGFIITQMCHTNCLSMTTSKSFLMQQHNPFMGRPAPRILSRLTLIKKLSSELSNSLKRKASLASTPSFKQGNLFP